MSHDFRLEVKVILHDFFLKRCNKVLKKRCDKVFRQWSGRLGFNPWVASYQRLKKWYLIPPCLTLSNIKYVSRVKCSNPGKGVAPFPTPRCGSYWKGSLRVTLDYSRQLYLYTTAISRPVHIHRLQYLIYWKWCQHMPGEGVNCCWQDR